MGSTQLDDEFMDEPDMDHPVRWIPVSGKEETRWVSFATAERRLARYGIEGAAVLLREARTLRTPFAYYELDENQVTREEMEQQYAAYSSSGERQIRESQRLARQNLDMPFASESELNAAIQRDLK